MSGSEQNNGFGELPKSRGNGTKFTSIVIILIFVSVLVSFRIHNKEQLWSKKEIGDLCAIITAILLGSLFKSLVLFGEEIKHLCSRYSDSAHEAFVACFPPIEKSTSLIIAFCIGLMGTNVFWVPSTDSSFTFYHLAAVALVSSFINVSLSRAELSNLNETENKHVADGLAWSYYYGYLKLMLPSIDVMVSTAVKDDYCIGNSDLRDKLSSKKIFIVIPKDCYTYESFTNVDSRITFASSMPPQHITRGGVQERVYKNTVWKIDFSEDDKSYVMMEYATPCLSMYDMTKHKEAKFSQEDLEAQVKEFALKLELILESDAQCKGKYEIVLCGDVKSKNNKKLGDIILEYIEADQNDLS